MRSIRLTCLGLSIAVAAAFVAASVPSPHISAIPAPTPVWIKEKAETLNTVDGVNKVFRLSHTPTDMVEIGVFENGLYQSEDNDYSVNPANHRQITFVEAPPTGSLVRFWYLAAW